MADEDSGFRLLSDEPNIDAGDALGFEALSTKLSGSILRSRASTPFTLGIEGGWGSGKSSLMRRLQRDLGADPAVTTVWFNAWTAEGVGALEGLIKTVLDRLDPNILRRALRNRRLISGARTVALVIASRFGIGGLVDEVWDRVSVDARSRNELRGLLHEAMDDWRTKNAGVTGDRLLVIFVDDLDRASPTQVFEIFEAMKLYLDAPGFVFVVGYDHTIISEAVLEERRYSRSVTGREYIEKIVQVAYRLSPPDDPQAKRLMEHYTQDSGTTDLFDDAARTLVIDRNQRNPRRIKRFLNAFVLLYALDPDWRDLSAQRLVEVLLLDMYFPEFVALFRARADADPAKEFLDYRNEREQIIDKEDGAVRDEQINELERELPELYPILVADADFVSLVDAMRSAPRWDDVRTKLERRRRLTTTTPIDGAAPSTAPSPSEVPGFSFETGGMAAAAPSQPQMQQQQMQQAAPPGSAATVIPRLLWLDDEPAATKAGPEIHEAVDHLRSHGWDVVNVGDPILATRMLASEPFGAVVSNLDRRGDPETGFKDLMAIRQGGYEVPAALFSRRFTPQWRDRAIEMGVTICRTPEQLLAWASTLPAASPS